MPDINQYSDISGYVQTVYDEAMFVARENVLVANLVRVFNDRDSQATRTNSRYAGTITLTSVGDTDDLTSQAFNPETYKSITPAEYAGQVFITDKRLRNDPFGAAEDTRNEFGLAQAAHIERALIGNFSSLTGGTVGGGGTAPKWSTWYAALAAVRRTNRAGSWVAVMHPDAWYHLGTAAALQGNVSQANAPEFQNDVMRSFWMGRANGIDIYTSTYCASGGTSIYGAIFDREAIALDLRVPFTIEPERDASRRGWELNASLTYGHGVWRPEYGVCLLGDVTTPTGA